MKSIAEVFPNRLCGVLRTDNAEAGFQACLSAMEGGVMTIEVTKTVPSCFEMIRGLIATTMGRYPVGVGTVWDPGAVREAKDAGASFVVTPSFGDTSAGAVGTVVSIVKLCVADDVMLPAVSVALARQYHVPSASDGDQLTVEPLVTELKVFDAVTLEQAESGQT